MYSMKDRSDMPFENRQGGQEQGQEYEKSSGANDVSVFKEDKKIRNTRRPVRSVKLGRPERPVRLVRVGKVLGRQ
jgi:hypothetical protein